MNGASSLVVRILTKHVRDLGLSPSWIQFKYLILMSQAPVTVLTFCSAGLFNLMDLMHCLVLSQWPLVLSLHLYIPPNCSEVINLPTYTAFPAIHGALPLQVPCTTIFRVSTNFLSLTSSLCCLLWHGFCLFLLIELNSFTSLILSNTAFFALCASTL